MNTKRAPMDVDKEFNSESCRICLTPNDKMSNIFARTLLTKIEYCTGIKIKNEDGLPTKICKSCQTSLTVAHKFKKLCLLTEQICRNVLESNIKTEQTHDASKIVNNNSNEDYLNDGWLKQDQSNNNFNGDCLKKDNENFNGDKINDNSDNVLNDVSDQDNGVNAIIKEEIECEYEGSTENVSKEIINSLEGNSCIDRPRRTAKPRFNKESIGNIKNDGKKRGPYRKKTETPKRRRKFKYFQLFCETCQIKFTCKKDSDEHRDTVHKETWSAICEVCGKLFASRGAYSSHIRYHLPPSFFCEHCDYRSSYRWDLVKHLLIHTGEPICIPGVRQAVRESRRVLLAHQIPSRPPSSVSTATTAAATGGTWSNICSYTPVSPSVFQVCGKLFASRGAYSSHIRYHLPPSFFCEHCDYRSSYRWDLVKHLLIHTGIKQYQCSQCPNNYYTVSNLREHERVVHERVLRYACDVCGKMFYDRTHLRRHVDSHSDIKRFECEVCHSAFTRRCHWKKHLLKQHGITIPAQRPGRVRVGATGDSLAPDAADAVRRLRINHI
nr:LOW QUALITY PROTEIN: zinc finger protein 320-like [Maniola hyperantus]